MLKLVDRPAKRAGALGRGRISRAGGIKQTCGMEKEIAKLRSGEGEGRTLGEQAEPGIKDGDFGTQGGVLTKGGGENDLPAHPLHVPVIARKSLFQP